MFRLRTCPQRGALPEIVKVSTVDDSNCRTDYEYNDISINDDIYTVIFPDSAVYIVESEYSLQALADWDAKHAQLYRQIHENGRYALPRGRRSTKVVGIISLGERRLIGAKQLRKCQPRLARDKVYNIWASQPGVRIIPVKNVVILERICPELQGGPRYKAVIPKKDWLTKRQEFKGCEKVDIPDPSHCYRNSAPCRDSGRLR